MNNAHSYGYTILNDLYAVIYNTSLPKSPPTPQTRVAVLNGAALVPSSKWGNDSHGYCD